LARTKEDVNLLKQAVDSCFSPEWIQDTARRTGYLQRSRKIDVVAFFWTLLLSFGTGVSRAIADLRRNYEQATGEHLVPSSFYDRFNRKLVAFLKQAVRRACKTMSEPVESLTGKLSCFLDLLIADATVIRLHDLLEKAYKGCWSNHTRSALKLHLVISVTSISPHLVMLTPERTRESRVFKVGPWVRNRLILLDLGYYDFSLFERIGRNGGYFISRLKSNANPVITGVNRVCRGRSIKVVGRKLQEVLPRLKRKTFDFEVRLTVRHREYLGKRKAVKGKFRIVGVWDEKSGGYHVYLTNVPTEKLSAGDVARTYACRWEVELLFKELKSNYRIDQLPSCKREVVEALIYVSILTLILSRALLFAMRRIVGVKASRSPERRWAATLQSCALSLLFAIIRCPFDRDAWKRIEKFLRNEMIDPNVKRARNLEVARP
jgi:putative transposase